MVNNAVDVLLGLQTRVSRTGEGLGMAREIKRGREKERHKQTGRQTDRRIDRQSGRDVEMNWVLPHYSI